MGKELIELIKKKQEQIDKLQAELNEARTMLSSGGRIVPTAEIVVPRLRVPSRPKGQKRSATVLYKPDSSVGRAVEVLRDTGKPLHIDEIIARIEQRGHKVKKTTLVGMISVYVKRGVLFERVKPNTFGLLEWKH